MVPLLLPFSMLAGVSFGRLRSHLPPGLHHLQLDIPRNFFFLLQHKRHIPLASLYREQHRNESLKRKKPEKQTYQQSISQPPQLSSHISRKKIRSSLICTNAHICTTAKMKNAKIRKDKSEKSILVRVINGFPIRTPHMPDLIS